MRAQPEHVEQSLFFQRVDLDPRTRGLLITAVPNGGWRHKAVAAKLKAEGVRAGVPDVICFDRSPAMAPTDGGDYRQYAGLAIEFKIKPNKPTPSQEDWMRRLHERGWRCAVAYSAEEAWSVLTHYLGFQP